MAIASKTNERMFEYYCLSTDLNSIPTATISNGSVAYTFDDQKVYMWDSENQIWIEQ